jgi:hypothetical protein
MSNKSVNSDMEIGNPNDQYITEKFGRDTEMRSHWVHNPV